MTQKRSFSAGVSGRMAPKCYGFLPVHFARGHFIPWPKPHYVRNLLAKLAVTNRTEAVQMAMQRRLIR